MNGVSFRRGTDNEYGYGQRRGTAEGNVEWKKPNRTKRPNKPNRAKRHCPFHLAPQALQIKCPSFYPETASTPEDNEWTAKGVMFVV